MQREKEYKKQNRIFKKWGIITYKRMKITLNFSLETIQVRVEKKKTHQPTILYPAKLPSD